MNQQTETLNWHRVAGTDELPEGRVKTVTAGTQSMALTHIDGEYFAMDNRCPHQGGPLGEGSSIQGMCALTQITSQETPNNTYAVGSKCSLRGLLAADAERYDRYER